MSGQSVIAFAQRFAPRRVEQGRVVDVTPEPNPNDLEVLAARVDTLLRAKVVADADLLSAQRRCEEIDEKIKEAHEAFRDEARQRGIPCRI